MFLRILGCLLSYCIFEVFPALPACAPGVTCPPGGIWSEWTVSGDTQCATECGSCSKLFYIRNCLSAGAANCSCTGLTTKYAPCNTEICSYPAQRTCCIPYLPMLINGTMQCGPFPRETTVGTGPCCPGSGLWSEWTSFAKDENSGSYKKTRQCVSSSAGCGCTGSAVQSQAQCPCARTLKNADVCAEKDASIGKTFNMRLHRDLAITDINCTATLMLEANNDNVTSGGPEMCHSLNNYDYVPAIVLLLPSVETRGPSNKCYMDRPLNCNNRVTTVKDLPVSFTCDLETLLWRYDYLGWFVEGYNQPAFKVT